MNERYFRTPKNVKVSRGKAWWYANRGSLELHVDADTQHFVARLSRRELADYVRRTERPKK
jgi:hypothetical protein